jgi:hypothetical protein
MAGKFIGPDGHVTILPRRADSANGTFRHVDVIFALMIYYNLKIKGLFRP